MTLSARRIAQLLLALYAGVLVLQSAPPAAAQPVKAQDITYAPDPLRYDEAVRKSRALIDTLMEREGVPGVTAAVLVGDDIAWTEGFGWADVENRVPVAPHTMMRVGSVSKPLTSVAVGQLVEDGELDLDAPVQQYVSYFPEKRYPITTRQVAGHRAGIRHYRGDEFLSREHYESIREGVEIFADDTLLFEPGTEYQYSSYGWNLVSAVVEEASGKPFLRYMREAVFQPMNLRHTVAGHPDSLIAHRTRFYVRDSTGQLLNAPYVDNSYKWAGGGFLSTASDLVRFGDAMLDNEVLAPETVKMLFAPQQTTDGESTQYGIGWRTSTDDAGRRMIGHSGGSVGGSTQFLMYPEAEVVVALIANMSDVDYDDIEERIARLFLEAKR